MTTSSRPTRHHAFLDRRGFVALALGGTAAVPAFAHHGWSGYLDDEFSLTGTVEAAHLGSPHGHLDVRSDGVLWDVVLGPPARNRRAGLTDGVVGPGDTVTAYGQRHRDPERHEMKTERLLVGDAIYAIYPERF